MKPSFVFSLVYMFSTHAAVIEWPSIFSESFNFSASPFSSNALSSYPVTQSFATRSSSSSNSVDNGNNASAVKKHQLPFVATLIPRNMISSFDICGGSVVASNYVLTSAACCGCGQSLVSDAYFDVVVNSFHYNSATNISQTFEACTEHQQANEFYCHPSWTRAYPNANSFCLVRLKTATNVNPVTLYDPNAISIIPSPGDVGATAYGTSFFNLDALYAGQNNILKKIRLPSGTLEDYDYEYVTDSSVSPLISDVLQKSPLILQNTTICSQKHVHSCTNVLKDAESGCAYCAVLESTQTICANTETKYGTMVFGDLGSPLFVRDGFRFVQIGVMNDFDIGRGTIYARVDTASFKNWITPFLSPPRPTTSQPTQPTRPTRRIPTRKPSRAPTTKRPTRFPTLRPTRFPTLEPTLRPTKSPTNRPTTWEPTVKLPPSFTTPTFQLTKKPTMATTKQPTKIPTRRPTKAPTGKPTRPTKPTLQPTAVPTSPLPSAPSQCASNVFP